MVLEFIKYPLQNKVKVHEKKVNQPEFIAQNIKTLKQKKIKNKNSQPRS